MDENVEPVIESVTDSGTPVTKRKTRRGNKGKPRNPASQDDDMVVDPVHSLTEAARMLMISQGEVLETAFGLPAKPSTSNSTAVQVARKPRKKVAEFLLEQSLARAAGISETQLMSCDPLVVLESKSCHLPMVLEPKSCDPPVVLEEKTVLKEKAIIEQKSSEKSPSKSKKKPVGEKKSESQVEGEVVKPVEPGKKKSRSKKKSKPAGTEAGTPQQSSASVKTEEQLCQSEDLSKQDTTQSQAEVVSAQVEAVVVPAVVEPEAGQSEAAEAPIKKKKPHKKKLAKAAARAAQEAAAAATSGSPIPQPTAVTDKNISLLETTKKQEGATPSTPQNKVTPGSSKKKEWKNKKGDTPKTKEGASQNTPKNTGTPKTPKSNNKGTPDTSLSIEQGTPDSARRRSPRKSRSSGGDMEDNSFPAYWSSEDVERGLQDKTLTKGSVRINKKNFREAYITSPDGGMDIMLEGIRARNRCLEGDEVIVQIFPADKWKGTKSLLMKQKTGQVVQIVRKVHHRQAVGTIKPMQEPNSVWALFSPRDSRVPRVRVPHGLCPPNYHQMGEMLYLVQINDWSDVRYAVGCILEIIGMGGSVESETVSILAENGLNVEPYGIEMAQYFPSMPYKISQTEIDKREDLRKLCIFTIDPATARDLDDAVSYRELPDGQGAEIGVHISDVAFFLKEETPLDSMVCSRATTTYLVQNVYHMLPVELCRLCSLTPGEDKLAFSVLWRVTPQGEFLEPRFTRSVIHSCTQMAYQHAQDIIDAPLDKQWSKDELPEIHGGFTVEDVVRTVQGLRPLALALRDKRFEGGALRIDQPKLCFSLDEKSGLPKQFFVYKNQECHRLIEELMLLANTAVAHHLHQHQPDIALLRSHPAPHDHMLPELQSMLSKNGIELDISSSGAMHTSLQRYLGSSDPAEVARGWALSALLSKPMARARYFCAQGTAEEEQWHYALSVPLYTHFTSPIRRYADVMVHRLLAATLDYTPLPTWHSDYVSSVASNCNGKKYSAKRAGEQSGELYLSLYVGMHGPLREEAVVIDVKDHSFDVLVLSTGSNHRVYTNNLSGKLASVTHKQAYRNVWEAHIQWKEPSVGSQTIKLFSLVIVELRKAEKDLRIDAKLVPPLST